MSRFHDRLPGVSDWLAALPRLERRGKEYVGACPNCGGTDRFHLREGDGGTAIVGCRGCIDGLPRPERAKRFGEMLRAAGLSQPAGVQHVQSAFRNPEQNAPAVAQDASNAKQFGAVKVWARTVAAKSGCPSRLYLADRMCWPDRADVPVPRSVRWLPRERMPRSRGFPPIPRHAAGAIAFRYEDMESGTSAVSLEALDGRGRRLEPASERWRRTVGTRLGAIFRAGCPDGSPLVVAEGELDALAASWLHGAEAECVAVGGTAGLAGWVPGKREGRPVVIECDGDPAGTVAAIKAERRLQKMGYSVSVRWRAPGEGDAADELARRVRVEGWSAIAGIE